MNDLPAHIMVTAMFAMIAMVIMAFMNFLLKRRMLGSDKVDERYLKLISKPSDTLSSLKWGIILFFGGVGLIILGLLPFSAEESPIPWGVETIFIAAGFLVYYVLARKQQP